MKPSYAIAVLPCPYGGRKTNSSPKKRCCGEEPGNRRMQGRVGSPSRRSYKASKGSKASKDAQMNPNWTASDLCTTGRVFQVLLAKPWATQPSPSTHTILQAGKLGELASPWQEDLSTKATAFSSCFILSRFRRLCDKPCCHKHLGCRHYSSASTSNSKGECHGEKLESFSESFSCSGPHREPDKMRCHAVLGFARRC